MPRSNLEYQGGTAEFQGIVNRNKRLHGVSMDSIHDRLDTFRNTRS
jgi:hypothetical protein